MKPSNSEVVASIEKRRPVSRVGQLRREQMIASKLVERSKEADNNQADSLNPALKK
jgi:hypothetical protein